MDNVESKLYDKVCRVLVKEKISELSPMDMFTLLRTAMEYVEKLIALDGNAKRVLVSNTMNTVLTNTITDSGIKEIFRMMIDPAITAICEVGKHRWNVNSKPTNACCFRY